MPKRRPKTEIVSSLPEAAQDARQSGARIPVDQWIGGNAAWIACALVLIATLRIASAYTIFSHTSDEPAHLACGMEWLAHGSYTYEHQHPPLARVAAALLPYLDGVRPPDTGDMWMEGRALLIKDNKYDRVLALARTGTLPFFWIASAFVFLWAQRILDGFGAVIAVLLFTNLPPVLGHAGLATTDMALTACLTAALFSLLRMVDQPSWRSAVLFGLCGGLAIASKFSALAYFPAAAGAAFAAMFLFAPPDRVRLASSARRVGIGAAIAAPFCILAIWAVYRFSLGNIHGTPYTSPFPELFTGVHDVIEHNRTGHGAFLMGERSLDGWFAFFPIVVSIKTPLGFLALAAIGLWRGGVRRGVWSTWVVWTMAAGMLLFAMNGRINIGVRHVLPIYTLFSVGAAAGVAALWKRWSEGAGWALWLAGALMLWNLGHVAINHPDYLAYFNELGGSEPEEIVVDSDLDWGQDLKRLSRRLREKRVRQLTFTPAFPADLAALDFPRVDRSDPRGPSPGWNAVSLTYWKTLGLGGVQWNWRGGNNREQANAVKAWPDFTPKQERIGRGMILYYFPDPDAPARR
ncbi:MAG: glycosyltransferase family 39 protein [Bryobacteraceae bacterium]